MGIFDKKIGPVFLKETSDATAYIEKMEILKTKANCELEGSIDQDIMLAKYGLVGENNIAFELKNSGMDMYILHDLYLVDGDLSAQIDYLVVTRKRIYIIECKNLIGNIEIDNTGTFIRNYEWNGKKKKEAVYSPITQNERHRLVLKAVRAKSKNVITRILFEKNFDSMYQGVVVLANPKTCLFAKFAKKEVKNQVIRADQLISYLKSQDALVRDSMSNDNMYELAKFFLDNHKENQTNYARKYEEAVERINAYANEVATGDDNINNIPERVVEVEEKALTITKDRSSCIMRLKEFRLNQSRKENIKPYYIFNDAQMEELMEKNPKTKDELITVSGFGEKKVEKYGDAILTILKEELS